MLKSTHSYPDKRMIYDLRRRYDLKRHLLVIFNWQNKIIIAANKQQQTYLLTDSTKPFWGWVVQSWVKITQG